MALDPRVAALLGERQVQCTLRKQPKPLTQFFYERLRDFALLSERPDADSPAVKSVKDKLFTALKFVGKPNDQWRKEEYVRDRWPEVAAELAALP